jgi:hypothetical protein
MGHIFRTMTNAPFEEKVSIRALHDPKYDAMSDPLLQGSCIFAAMIYDVDHEGVASAQMLKSTTAMAYRGRRVDEHYFHVLACDFSHDAEIPKSTHNILLNNG